MPKPVGYFEPVGWFPPSHWVLGVCRLCLKEFEPILPKQYWCNSCRDMDIAQWDQVDLGVRDGIFVF